VEKPLLIKRSGGTKDPEWAATGDVEATIEGAKFSGHLVLIFSPMYPNQLEGGSLGVEGCSAAISGHHR
jgi:hypothetical protein